jgi:hypothetical protein
MHLIWYRASTNNQNSSERNSPSPFPSPLWGEGRVRGFWVIWKLYATIFFKKVLNL